MARTKQIDIDGVAYKLQSVTYTWYANLSDKYLSGGKRNTAKYVDSLIKGCVIEPAEVSKQGIAYFDEIEDCVTPAELAKEIELFLGERPKR